MSTFVMESGYVYPTNCSSENRATIAEALRAGDCPCESDVDDPGPRHLPMCPWRDPNYLGFGAMSWPGSVRRERMGDEALPLIRVHKR